MKQLYSCAGEIVNRPFPTEQYLGVSVHGPYEHAGMQTDVVDVEIYLLELSSQGYGRATPVIEWQQRVVTDLDVVIDDLTKKLVELHQHRQRLIEERERLRREPPTLPDGQMRLPMDTQP